jgi:hypothetical protein
MYTHNLQIDAGLIPRGWLALIVVQQSLLCCRAGWPYTTPSSGAAI